MATIILDTIITPAFINYLKRHNIDFKIINDFGPGGGCPEIKYMAKKNILKKMIKDYWQDIELYEFIAD